MGLEINMTPGSMDSCSGKYDAIKTQSDAVIHFLKHLDIEMLDAVLEENRTYQDFEKPIFIQKLGQAFEEFGESGDTILNFYPGLCNAKICNYKCTGFRFIGNISGNYLDLIIEIKDGVVQDMYECRAFKCAQKTPYTRKRIIIDKSALSI